MEKHFSKRRLIPVAVALLALVCASGVAYAYWTASGIGSGTGKTAVGVTSLTATSAALNEMYPGNSAQPIVITVQNPTTQPVYVTSVSASVTDTGDPGCLAIWFPVAGSPVAVGAEIAALGNLTLSSPTYTPPTIRFDNLPVDQSVCKDKTITLSFTIS
jgi:hypothetical protein